VKTNEYEKARQRLFKICTEMDKDGDGHLSMLELSEGFDAHAEFSNTLRAMDISRDDISLVFSIMDEDGSGEIDYNEFVEQVYKMKSSDSHTLLVFIKHYVTEVRSNVLSQMALLQDMVSKTSKEQAVTLSEIAASVGVTSHLHGPWGRRVDFDLSTSKEKQAQPNVSADSSSSVGETSLFLPQEFGITVGHQELLLKRPLPPAERENAKPSHPLKAAANSEIRAPERRSSPPERRPSPSEEAARRARASAGGSSGSDSSPKPEVGRTEAGTSSWRTRKLQMMRKGSSRPPGIGDKEAKCPQVSHGRCLPKEIPQKLQELQACRKS